MLINIQTGPCYRNYVATLEHISREIIMHCWSAVCQQFPQTRPFTSDQNEDIEGRCTHMEGPRLWHLDTPYGRLFLYSQKGGVSLDWPCLDTLMLYKLTPFNPYLFDCYGCLRKIRRRHYHINRATGTRRTGNLSSSSSMEARRNNKVAWAKTGIGLPTPSA